MRTQYLRGFALALTVAVVACDESSTGPEQAALDNAETEFLAMEADQSINFMLDDALAAYGDPQAGIVMAAEQDGSEPIVTNFTFERTRPCRVSGEVVATGEGTKVKDGSTVTLDVSGTKHQIECARVRGDVVITVNGVGEFEAHRKRVEGVLVEATSAVHGAFRWETSNGRSGSCEYRILREFLPETDQIKVTGTICGHEIDRVIDKPVDRPRDSA